MRVLCVIEDLGCGGAQRQLVSAAVALRSRRHQVELFAYYPDDHYRPTLEAAGIPVHICAKPRRASVGPALRLRRLVSGRGFDAVLSFMDTPNTYAELALLGVSGVRLVASERTIFPDGGATLARRLRRQLHRRAFAVTTNSRTQKLWLERACPWLRGRVHAIYNGVDLAVFAPVPRTRRFGVPVRLLAAGRIGRDKNTLALVRALEICRGELGLEVTVHWAGRSGDAAYHASCVEAIREAGLDRSWDWLGQRTDMQALMPRYDALILPSLWEGLPNVVCEALAAGLPVLASDVSDNPYLVAEGETGFLFAPDDPRAIAGAIRRLAAISPEAHADMGRRARSFAEAHLSLARCVDAYERLLCGSSPARGWERDPRGPERSVQSEASGASERSERPEP